MSRLALLAWLFFARVDDASLPSLLDRYQAEPSNALLCEQIGVAYTRQNDFENAARFFRAATALNPERTSARKNLATVLWFLGRKKESSGIFDSLEKTIPGDPVPQLYLGLHAYDLRNMESAAAHFERAGALASDNPEIFPFLVETYISTGRSELAARILELRISTGASDARTYRWLGNAYDSQMQPDRALPAYSEAIRRDPKSEENYLALAGFSMEHANASFAREVLTRGLVQIPDSARLLLELGLAWAIQGDFEEARKSFASANAVEPAWPLPLLALGVTDLQTGSADSASEYFRKARNVAPDDYRCYYLHSVALNRSRGKEDASVRATVISELRHAIALDPEHAQPRVALADAEIADGHMAAAEAELREAIRIEPTEPSALYKLALLYRREGKTREAERMLHSFQQLKNKAHSEENQFVLILKTVK